MSSRPKATIASSLASDLEAALVQVQAQAGAAIPFADFLPTLAVGSGAVGGGWIVD
jgi:hypothetical protein